VTRLRPFETKLCAGCGESKPTTAFERMAESFDRSSRCRSCERGPISGPILMEMPGDADDENVDEPGELGLWNEQCRRSWESYARRTGGVPEIIRRDRWTPELEAEAERFTNETLAELRSGLPLRDALQLASRDTSELGPEDPPALRSAPANDTLPWWAQGRLEIITPADRLREPSKAAIANLSESVAKREAVGLSDDLEPLPEDEAKPARLGRPAHPRRERLLELLGDGPRTATDLAQAIGEPTSIVRHALNHLGRRGHVQHDGFGQPWRLASSVPACPPAAPAAAERRPAPAGVTSDLDELERQLAENARRLRRGEGL